VNCYTKLNLTDVVVELLHTTVILACRKVLAIWTKTQAWNITLETILVDYPPTHHANQMGFTLWKHAETQ
jgi:hypothetical protein